MTSADPLRGVWHACADVLAGTAAPRAAVGDLWSRGDADLAAARARFGVPGDAPSGLPAAAADVYEALLDARVAVVAARRWPGAGRNLQERGCRLPPTSSAAQLHRAVLCAAEVRGGWLAAELLPAPLGRRIARLVSLVDTPAAYHHVARRLSLAVTRGTSADARGNDNAARAVIAPHARGRVAAHGNHPGAVAVAGSVPSDDARLPYRVYSRLFDEQIDAAALVTPDECARLRRVLDDSLTSYRGLVERMAHRLMRVLTWRQRRVWLTDRDEGCVDGSRLAVAIANPARGDIFRVESPDRRRALAVSLLVDHSGSMRGRPIAVAAITAEVLTQALERCGVDVEVLGFTTTDWMGGPCAAAWRDAGMPAQPGRLNALRHIVYKSMAMPWRRARGAFGVFLHPDILKENVDGEALQWAAARLARRAAQRRVLVVISDGAPMDRATSDANGPDLLAHHLRATVTQLRRRGEVEVKAIGIGYPVSRWYDDSLLIRQPEDLGSVLPEQLGKWLS